MVAGIQPILFSRAIPGYHKRTLMPIYSTDCRCCPQARTRIESDARGLGYSRHWSALTWTGDSYIKILDILEGMQSLFKLVPMCFIRRKWTQVPWLLPRTRGYHSKWQPAKITWRCK